MGAGILITGANGQLGQELQDLFGLNWNNLKLHYLGSSDLDISDTDAVSSFFSSNKIEICINAAAYTAVDAAEEHRELAFAVNSKGAENLARACSDNRSCLIHVSTDFVFDGQATEPYQVDSTTSPLGVYGESKRAGEIAILENNPAALIVRTSWLYSHRGKNFLQTMLRLGDQRDEIGVVSDQTGSPTWARDLASAIQTICREHIEGNLLAEDAGVYHFCNQGACTWYDFATAIMEQAGLDCKVNPITTADYPTPARRPAYSVLDSSRIEKRFKLHIAPWRDSLNDCLNLQENTARHAGKH
jgi:dTDP-4-dehydrorhamnose reductase